MYPASFFGLFPPFPKDMKVFVAMSFEERFKKRWHQVIEPAVSSIQIDGIALEAVRVDARSISDSILTEILQGISQHRLVLADVTTIGYIEDGQRKLPIRNANVLYEVGIAHAVRLPAEVLLFRSDRDELIFDIANVRVNDYDPDGDPEAAKSLMQNSILSALKEVELRQHLAVGRAVESLDFPSWLILAEAQDAQGINHPPTRTMGQALGNSDRIRAIARLLDLGAIKTEYRRVTTELLQTTADEPGEAMLRYRATAFGSAIFMEGVNRIGMLSPDVLKLLEERFQQEHGGPSEQNED